MLKFLANRIKGNKRKSATSVTEEEALPRSVRSLINNCLGSATIPPMPSTARLAFELSVNPEAEVKDFHSIIQKDESLASRVVKIANSVYFDRGNPSRTVEESIIAIGLGELRSLLQATTLSQSFPSPSPIRSFLWSHDVATALSARVLANKLGLCSPEMAFLGALMHDIGKLFLLQRFPERYERVMALVRSDGRAFSEAETTEFPFSHEQVGVLIAEQWRFVPELILAIRDHHNNWDYAFAAPGISLTIKAANLCTHALGVGHPKGFQRVYQNAQKKLPEMYEALHISASDGEDLLKEVSISIENDEALYHSFE